ncbi:MAG: nitroreductase family protein, partial [Spirochaetaceae bacterium]|nr:nitroreductase family protein [Spirochaetaceae bacterium]
MDAFEAIRSRRSVRKYEERDIPRDTLEAIADCGRLAPSGHNKQPWAFAVVTDRDLLKAIAVCAEYGSFIAGAGACVAVFCGESATPLEDACAATENMIIAAAAA